MAISFLAFGIKFNRTRIRMIKMSRRKFLRVNFSTSQMAIAAIHTQ